MWNMGQILERITNAMNIMEIENTQKSMDYDHIDFIVGRGKNYPSECMNIPMNPLLNARNIILIDSNPMMGADIIDLLGNIDFTNFGISSQQDPQNLINLRFIFDWSTFYCSAIDSMVKITKHLKHKMEILVPMESTDQWIPSEILEVMDDPMYRITVEDGYYPLFDPEVKDSDQLKRIINTEKYIRIGVNPIPGVR